MSDTGLLCAKQDVVPDDILYMTPDLDEFKGGLTENYVDCQLISSGYTPYYWTGENNTEIDFVIQREGKIIPIEVKSADNIRSKSLKKYIELYHPEYAIRLSARNFGMEDDKRMLPLYAAFCI